MSLQTTMGQIKVGTRIYVGFLIILALIATVATVAYNGFTDSNDGFDSYVLISDNTANNLTIDRNIVGLRRNMLGYATTG